LSNGVIIIQGSKQFSSSEDEASWRDMGRNSSRYCLRSLNDGKTWNSSEHVSVGSVIDRTTGEMFRVGAKGNPANTPDGATITEAWTIMNWEKARELGRKMILSRSKDSGNTWVDQDLSDSLYNYPGSGLTWFIGHGIQLQRGPRKGRLIIPGRYFGTDFSSFDPNIHQIVQFSDGLGYVYLVNGVEASSIVSETAHNTLIYSDDHGETWKWGGSSQGFAGEACVVELSDGSVYMNNRNHNPETLGYRSWCISHDSGETFTEFGIDKTLIEGRCHASLARYDFQVADTQGRILFLNPAVFGGQKQQEMDKTRRNMTIRLSYDDGKTWVVSKCLHQGGAGYSDMIVLKNGLILCAFEIGDSGLPRDNIKVCRFSMEWLLS